MSYQALARKYRPQSFNDIIGQETVVRTLQNAIEQQRIHHAYLFSGVRGVGKTTAARILAKALNCVKGPAGEPCNECSICREITEGIDLDVREIDAATYTGVDNVRELREVTQFQPARDRYRVFIIDEAHMLSTPAWNALLKILEEPPPHVVFMFATTEVQKVPPTILSRVQKFALRKITLDELIVRLEKIARSEKIDVDRPALEIVARRGEGSVRDALSILDQVIAFSGKKIGAVEVATVLGLSDNAVFSRIVQNIIEGDAAAILESLQEVADSGRDFKVLYRDLLGFVRNVLLISGGASESLLSASPEDVEVIRSLARSVSYTEILRVANVLIRDDEIVNRAEHQRLAVEVALLKAATFPRLRSVEDALRGAGSAAAAPRTPTRNAERAPAPKPSSAKPAPPPSPRGDAPASDDLGALISRLQAARPLVASYLEQATSGRKEGSRIVWTFADPFYAGAVNDSKDAIEALAAEVYGSRVTVEAEGVAEEKSARRETDRPAASREDPVLQAFAKHLGGEVVAPRKR